MDETLSEQDGTRKAEDEEELRG